MNTARHRRFSFLVVTALILLISLSLISCSGGGGGGTTSNPTYTVTYDGNNSDSGNAPIDSGKYEAGQTVTVPGNTGSLVKAGNSFVGWNTLADGTGTIFAQSQTFTIGAANVTLYAKWTVNPTFTVIYDGNGSTGGSVPIDTTNYEAGQTVTVLGDTGSLARTGYSFVGWNTLADGAGTTYTQAQTFSMGSANVILYARWTVNPIYTVSYDGNGSTGGSVPIDTVNYEQGQIVTVLGNTGNLVKPGYAFAGWNTLADGTGTTYGATFSMGAVKVTLYAKWSPTYTVTYDGNGSTSGSVPIDATNYEEGQTVTVFGNGTLVNAGYAFVGWNSMADGTGTTYGASFTMGSANVTLYAKWNANPVLATVTTTAISGSTGTTAASGGNVTADGGAAVTARGICWNTSIDPTISNSHTTDGTGTGSFTSSLSGLAVYTTYYVRAYATNSAGTAYGNSVSFTTAAASATGGALDITFGTGGKVTTAIRSSYDTAYAVGIQSDGKIVAAGYSSNGSNDDFAVARYNTDGVLDSTFGTGGKVTTGIGSSHDEAYALGIQADGKIVTAGVSYNVVKSGLDFALARYNTDGTLDSSLGTSGTVTSDPGTPASGAYDHQAFAIGIQSDGKIVAAGRSYNGSNFPFTLVRYNASGSIDASFGTGGVVTTDFGNLINEIHALGIQSDGKIVAAGYTGAGANYSFAVARYNTDGSPDTAFGTGGKVTTSIYGNDGAYALGIQSDGKIVVAGYTFISGSCYIAVVRYNADGTLDSTFDTDGKVITSFGSGAAAASALGIQSDGKIVVAGYNYTGSSNDFAVVRYNTNGVLDSTFGTDGKVTTGIGTGSDDQAKALAIQPDGKIVAAGYTGAYDFAVVRYLP